jgi:hypothetical protein
MGAKRRRGDSSRSPKRPEKILEAQLSWAASLVLLLATVHAVVNIDVLWIVIGTAAISLYVLPIATTRNPFRALPWEMTILLSTPMLLHISAGARSMNDRFAWWDDLTSLAFAFSLATIGFLLTVELQMYTDVKMNRPFAVFFVVMFTLGASGFWAVGEYIDYEVFGSNLPQSNFDVMKTLLWTLIGGLLMGFVYSAYLKVMPKKRLAKFGFIHLYEVSKRKQG